MHVPADKEQLLPYTAEAAPYLLERAQARMNANQARAAMLDYDAYYKTVNGKVNDVFYYYREQAALKAKQFQRALNDLEKAIDAVKEEISKNEAIRSKYSTRFLAIKLLENDPDVERIIRTLPNSEEIIRIRDKAAKRIMVALNEDSESAITDAKYGFISGALKETFIDNHQEKAQMTKVLDAIVTHRVWGYPIFFLFMYIMFEGTFVLGEYPMMGIEWLVEALGSLINNHMGEGPLKDMLIDGIIGGVGGVIVFLPNILILYFFISLISLSLIHDHVPVPPESVVRQFRNTSVQSRIRCNAAPCGWRQWRSYPNRCSCPAPHRPRWYRYVSGTLSRLPASVSDDRMLLSCVPWVWK